MLVLPCFCSQVSDLSEEELFYFKARGIDEASARNMLVFSFGQEVVKGINSKQLRGRVEAGIKASLQGCMQA
jgi:Fe-S cluster assembly protein SufD